MPFVLLHGEQVIAQGSDDDSLTEEEIATARAAISPFKLRERKKGT